MFLPSLEFNRKRWNRLLIYSYWIAILLAFLVELFFLFCVTEMPASKFLSQYMMKPGLEMAAVLLGIEALIRFAPAKLHDYGHILASALLALILTTSNPTLVYMLILYIFPIGISIFYFQYKQLAFSIAVTFISLNGMYGFNAMIRENLEPGGLVFMNAVLLIYSGIAFGLLARGREILSHLQSTFESNQELLVRNIMMDKLAKTDALTDTYNHMAYHEYVEKLVEQAENGRTLLHLAVLDIDNFKQVNDTYGHRAGDTVLREVAAIARSKIGPNDFIARYGGEEFVILFMDSSSSFVQDTVEKIRRTVEQYPHPSLNGLNVTVSIGLNRYVRGMGKERLFKEADAALYEAKREGKNRTVLAEGFRAASHAETGKKPAG